MDTPISANVPPAAPAPAPAPVSVRHSGRRIAVIIGAIALVGLAGWFVYDRFFNKPLTEDEVRTAIVSQVAAESLPISDEAKAAALSDVARAQQSAKSDMSAENKTAILQMVAGQQQQASAQ